MGGRENFDVFVCGCCNMPKRRKQMSNKVFRSSPVCKNCIKKGVYEE
jgi:hypothetical protein